MKTGVNYYSGIFERIRCGRVFVWNWAAAILGPFWFLYRKMYSFALLLILITVVSQSVYNTIAILMVDKIGLALLSFLAALKSIFLILACGFLGNYLFYRKVKKKMGGTSEKHIAGFLK